MAVPLTSFGFACRVERVDIREKLDAQQTAELVKLFETPLRAMKFCWAPFGCLGDLLGMKSYPVMWGF